MATNTFLTSDLVARDSAIFLSDNLVMANLVNRNHEEKFAGKVGDSIDITVPPVQTARDFIDDGSVTDNAITESEVSLKLTEQPYIAHTLTSKEKSLELDAFNTVVTMPAVLAIRDAIDEYLIKQAVQGFQRYHVGGEASSPSSIAHLLAGNKQLEDNGVPRSNRVAVLGTTAQASLLDLAEFSSLDYNASLTGLQEAMLGRKFGYDFYVDQNCGTMDQSGTAEVTHMAGTETIGTSTITVDDNGGTSSGTVTKGGRFTIAGDTTVYTVTADATASGGAIELPIYPALVAQADDDDAISWEDASKEDIMFHRDAVAGAIVPPAPLAVNSSVAFYNGIGIRVSMSSSTSSLSDQIVFDTYCGGAVIQVKGGAVVGGS